MTCDAGHATLCAMSTVVLALLAAAAVLIVLAGFVSALFGVVYVAGRSGRR